MNKMKLKVLLIYFVLFCCGINSFGQNVRVWASYFGGNADEFNQAIAADASGNVYLTGYTSSTTGIASGGFQNTNAGNTDAYLAKIDNNGNLLWATYYGGSLYDYGKSVVVDASGNVYLGGSTNSTSGIASGGMQNVYGGGPGDAFLVKFDAAGNRLWATYIGGHGYEEGYGLGKDNLGNVFLTGSTTSTSNIAASGFNNSYSGGTSDAYLIKFDGAGNRLWGTYYGDTGDEWGWSIAADASNNVYLSGATSSSVGIASGGFQNTISAGYDDAFLVKFNSSGARIWATYYGNTGNEEGTGVCTDSFGDVYMAGFTESTGGISSGGFQNTYGGGLTDLFLVKFNSSGNRLWATYYGGALEEESGNVVYDGSGFVYMAGDSYSNSGIASGGYQNSLTGIENQLVVKFSLSGTRMCATYYGQVHDEFGNVASDNLGNIFISGSTQGTSGIASGGFQNTYAGGLFDAYVAKFNTCSQTGIEEKNETDEIKIYPNPCAEKIYFYGNEQSDLKQVEIIDLLGKRITVKLNGNSIDVSDLNDGIYFLSFSGKEKSGKLKFCKALSR